MVMDRWIRTSERLPDPYVSVIFVHADFPQVKLGWAGEKGEWYEGAMRFEGHDARKVTHWMPLPKLPNGDE